MIVRRPSDFMDLEPHQMIMQKRIARDTMRAVRQTLAARLQSGESTALCFDDILQEANVSIEMFENAVSVTYDVNRVILRRQPVDKFINNYNPAILK